MGLEGYLLVSAMLFGIGAFGFMARRNAILMLISIELMFNAVNLSLVAFNAFLPPAANAERPAMLFAPSAEAEGVPDCGAAHAPPAPGPPLPWACV